MNSGGQDSNLRPSGYETCRNDGVLVGSDRVAADRDGECAVLA